MKFEMVEAFAIDADHSALADESGGIHLVDDMENLTRLTFLGQHKEHFDVMAGIKALRIEHGDSTMRFLVDAAGDFFVMA